jgi:hypothetical protein
LVWAEELHPINLNAWDFVRNVFCLPSERLLNSGFVKQRHIISDALQDSERIPELIGIWKKGRPPSVPDHRVKLTVDAVAFRPLVAVTEKGEVEGSSI